jgi:hypothetical protein
LTQFHRGWLLLGGPPFHHASQQVRQEHHTFYTEVSTEGEVWCDLSITVFSVCK